MMRTTGIAMPGISVYRLAAGAATGASRGWAAAIREARSLRDRGPGEDGMPPVRAPAAVREG